MSETEENIQINNNSKELKRIEILSNNLLEADTTIFEMQNETDELKNKYTEIEKNYKQKTKENEILSEDISEMKIENSNSLKKTQNIQKELENEMLNLKAKNNELTRKLNNKEVEFDDLSTEMDIIKDSFMNTVLLNNNLSNNIEEINLKYQENYLHKEKLNNIIHILEKELSICNDTLNETKQLNNELEQSNRNLSDKLKIYLERESELYSKQDDLYYLHYNDNKVKKCCCMM